MTINRTFESTDRRYISKYASYEMELPFAFTLVDVLVLVNQCALDKGVNQQSQSLDFAQFAVRSRGRGP